MLWGMHANYSLNSLNGGYIGGYIGEYYRGDTRSLDYSSRRTHIWEGSASTESDLLIFFSQDLNRKLMQAGEASGQGIVA